MSLQVSGGLTEKSEVGSKNDALVSDGSSPKEGNTEAVKMTEKDADAENKPSRKRLQIG
ncbi:MULTISPECIES: hypothetical protein [Photorhabdus]|uniref:hypothetical protein n=1 Tax=Photorhabdus TaxID=29487 RepID=UPI00186465A8|nr:MULTISPECIES: hypothetical protein [Photorhabdus]